MSPARSWSLVEVRTNLLQREMPHFAALLWSMVAMDPGERPSARTVVNYLTNLRAEIFLLGPNALQTRASCGWRSHAEGIRVARAGHERRDERCFFSKLVYRPSIRYQSEQKFQVFFSINENANPILDYLRNEFKSGDAKANCGIMAEIEYQPELNNYVCIRSPATH